MSSSEQLHDWSWRRKAGSLWLSQYFLPLESVNIKQMHLPPGQRREWAKQAENEFSFKCFLSSLKIWILLHQPLTCYLQKWNIFKMSPVRTYFGAFSFHHAWFLCNTLTSIFCLPYHVYPRTWISLSFGLKQLWRNWFRIGIFKASLL